ncbi:MAG: NAD(P)-dependent oxidoreductase [Rhodospirillales bacterium]|nr:NAD(P)-dependent oxidoreductase [Rhodospirillales bacterium]MCW8952283.1 NAD(P)-dependent oxidoreductase [Rhodospirillales bacterium]MCW8971243.1 NAD(P)-dependent oxidoreductase [Rhodospirillales bacterium]MCW9001366.1 NAD(P)-dependent oxidoreductase [Rhodospirillales bacterium]MCW9039158.1 NAD(P)-dependent oxidoreductase [Rhodospirillales bacterium]
MTVNKDKTEVGFIGLGIMGLSMAGHIQAAGYKLHVYNRTKAKADELVAKGATWQDSPGDVAAASDVVITMVGYPKDVEDIYLGKDGIVDRAKPGACLIDMTTSEPTLAIKIYDAAKAKGLGSLDAPVSGGDVGAREARLSIMVGGDEADFNSVMPLFEAMGTNIQLQGKAGAGQHTKMCNQIVVAGNMLGCVEALSYAIKSGLDPSHVLESVGTGAASSFLLNNLGPKMIARDFAPGFFIHHYIKDMSIAESEADAMGLDLPALKLTKGLYEKIAAAGAREDGTQALIKAYEDQS